MCRSTENLANAVVSRLHALQKQISTAESCTGGLLAGAITAISGSSNVFEYGIITYANSVKERELGVSADTLSRFGAVSEQTAREMAEGIRKKSGADYGVSITGIAGPTGGSTDKPVGTIYIAASEESRTVCEKLSLLPVCGNDRAAIREETVKRTLQLLMRLLSADHP